MAERFCRKFGNFFHHNLTLCAECFIRNYILLFLSPWTVVHLCFMLSKLVSHAADDLANTCPIPFDFTGFTLFGLKYLYQVVDIEMLKANYLLYYCFMYIIKYCRRTLIPLSLLGKVVTEGSKLMFIRRTLAFWPLCHFLHIYRYIFECVICHWFCRLYTWHKSYWPHILEHIHRTPIPR